ncbi:MAG TPA: YqiA/YcfP family alpha/beta fold hydrolase [Vicinamibacterales bacterium]|nr:YqiA/YcfP family alpha/beta fold hydrolase [Vicinamibacterales bacterium]
MTRVGHVVYLHGFASSPGSTKAQVFRRELAARGVGLTCPDFNEPSFETLTIARMVEQACRAVDDAPALPVALIGSSLGGLVAVHAAASRPARVDRLVLLAPALDFGANRLRKLGRDGIEAWRQTGRLRVYHYGDKAERDVGFALYEDAVSHDASTLPLTVPALVFQGRRDESVDPAVVERWTRTHPLADLRLVDDGHTLVDSMPAIVDATMGFFELGDAERRGSR